MFTTTIDNAINRVQIGDTEIAIAHDYGAENPLDTYCMHGFAIQRDDRNSIAYDPDDVMGWYTNLRDELDEAIDDIAYYIAFLKDMYGTEWWLYAPEDSEALGYVAEAVEAALVNETLLKNYKVFTYKAFDQYGWPEFNVVIDKHEFAKAWGNEPEDFVLESLAKEYAAWADGDIYVIGVSLYGDEEYCGGITDQKPCYDDEALTNLAREIAPHLFNKEN